MTDSYNIAILGGSFAPATKAHMALIRTACDALNARGVLVPSSDYYVKRKLIKNRQPEPEFYGSYDRFRGPALYAILHEADPLKERLSISDIELNGQCCAGHTLETLDHISKTHKTAELYFIMGAEKLKTFRRWGTSSTILTRYHIAVAPYDGMDAETEIRRLFPTQTERFVILPKLEVQEGISSTKVRALAEADDYDAICEMTCNKTTKLIKHHRKEG